MLAIIAGIITLLIWLWLLLAHGGFWRVRRFMALPRNSDLAAKIAVIIPARDEAEVVGRCISSLLRQTYRGPVHIFLVDDGSKDGTAQAARQAAERSGKTSALTIIQGAPPPSGWSGKLWAAQQGIRRARELGARFFLLTDADIEHAPESISTLAAIAESGGYDLASYMVKLHCITFAERLLIPAFVFFFFKLYPASWIANPRRKTAGAAGGCILIRPQALERAGGIEAVRSEIIDDCALAKAVKQSGGRVWLGVTELASSIRPYGAFAGIAQMISRSAFSQLHHSAFMLLLAMAGLIATYLLPPVLLFAGHSLPALLGATAWLLMIIAYMPMIRFYRLTPLWTLFLPVVAIFYMGATLHSAIKYWRGRGGEWKGRVQDPAR
ncbi:MAG: glycosyl transferase family 2 [Candidatus Angelobacter sp. Gp1-AA117]|nr:MAG: glycosyl transferase family 2 [Candidatus Angelobacter sp. Gp1-AA117]